MILAIFVIMLIDGIEGKYIKDSYKNIPEMSSGNNNGQFVRKFQYNHRRKIGMSDNISKNGNTFQTWHVQRNK